MEPIGVAPLGVRHTRDEQFSFRRRDAVVLADDVVHLETSVCLSWADRLRALFGRQVYVKTETPIRVTARPAAPAGCDEAEVWVGETTSRAWAGRIFKARRLTASMVGG